MEENKEQIVLQPIEDTSLDRAKEEAIVMVIFGSVVANTWTEVLHDLYRKTINPLTKNGKPRTTIFEDKLKCYIKSTGNFLKVMGWNWSDGDSYNNIVELTESSIRICRLSKEKRKEVYELINTYYKEIYGEQFENTPNS